ncbi:MAG TPA: hypothetical protein VGK74_07290 [Symbiobacteriaceae bacterium]|jgi:hypothetical protein
MVSVIVLWAAALGGAWAASREHGDRSWVKQLWWLVYLSVFDSNNWDPALRLLTDGVLVIFGGIGATTRYIPLGTAEILKRSSQGVSLRWLDGKRYRRGSIELPENAAAELEQAVREAGQHPDLPRTSDQAAHAARIATDWTPPRTVASAVIGFLVLLGTALWFNQPLVLAPLIIVPLLRFRARKRVYALVGNELLVLVPGEEPEHIALAGAVVTEKKGQLQVETSHPRYPVIRLATGNNSDLARSLIRRAAGEPDPAPPAPVRLEPKKLGAALRCSLCGREVERSPVAPPPGETVVCEHCEARVRLEAQEGGHGLAGREPRPLG